MEELQESASRCGRGRSLEATAKAPMGVCWVDVGKSTGEDGSRLVAQDFRPKSRVWDVMGFFVALPPVDSVISAAAERSRSGYTEKVVMIDVLKAHLHAAIAGSVYLNFLSERELGKSAKLQHIVRSATGCLAAGEQQDVGRGVRDRQGEWRPLRQQDARCSIGSS